MFITYRTLPPLFIGVAGVGCFVRPTHPEVPPKVECTLTERGRSLVAVLGELCDRGEADRP